ncbi:MAG: TIGR03086 family metal-binding protein [Acidothermaceae bacterium]
MIDLVPAARRTGALIAGITDEQIGVATPCPRYTLGDLLDHVDGLAQAFTNAATKQSPEDGGPTPSGAARQLGPDWRTRIPKRLLAMAEAWHDPSAWEGVTAAGGVQLPGEIAGLVALNETMVHGWDIARATGQAYDVEAEHAEQCIRVMGPRPGEERLVGDDVPFGRPFDVSPDAPPLDRLIATMGSNPDWVSAEP